MRTHYCGEITESLIGQEITVCGWVHRRRDHGGVIFIDLRDREGLLQVVYDPDIEDAFATAESVRSEYVLQVKGLVRNRPEGTTNDKLKSGHRGYYAKYAQYQIAFSSVFASTHGVNRHNGISVAVLHALHHLRCRA